MASQNGSEYTVYNGRRKAFVLYDYPVLSPATGYDHPLERYYKSAIIASTGCATPVSIMPDTAVGSPRQIYVKTVRILVNGSTAWTGGSFTTLTVQDSQGGLILSVPAASLTGNAFIVPATAGNTLGQIYSGNLGATRGAGLQILGDANAGAGSNVVVTVSGFVGGQPS